MDNWDKEFVYLILLSVGTVFLAFLPIVHSMLPTFSGIKFMIASVCFFLLPILFIAFILFCIELAKVVIGSIAYDIKWFKSRRERHKNERTINR